jgi:hypothetical protein
MFLLSLPLQKIFSILMRVLYSILAVLLFLAPCSAQNAEGVVHQILQRQYNSANKTSGSVNRLMTLVNSTFDYVDTTYKVVDSSVYVYTGSNSWDDIWADWKYDTCMTYRKGVTAHNSDNINLKWYDGSGQMVEKEFYSFDTSRVPIPNVYRFTYAYQSGKVIADTFQIKFWNSGLMMHSRKTHDYYPNGTKREYITFMWDPSGWQPGYKTSCLYHPDDSIKEVANFSWDVANSQWTGGEKRNYQFVNGQRVEETLTSANWVSRTLYTRGQLNRVLKMYIGSTTPAKPNAMDTTTFVAFHYTGNDADTAITYLRGSIGGWSPNRRVYVTYNVYHQPLVSIEEVWDGTRWVGAKQSRYYYEKDGLRIADVKSKAVRINLYPNPGVDNKNQQLENSDA